MAKIDELNPEFKTKVEIIISALNNSTGLKWIVVQGVRTIAYQNELYSQGRTKPGQIVTNAKGGQSAHNFKLAADIAPLNEKGTDVWWNCPKKYWDCLGQVAEGMGLTWGGHFRNLCDLPHVEDPKWKDAQASWKRGELVIE